MMSHAAFVPDVDAETTSAPLVATFLRQANKVTTSELEQTSLGANNNFQEPAIFTPEKRKGGYLQVVCASGTAGWGLT